MPIPNEKKSFTKKIKESWFEFCIFIKRIYKQFLIALIAFFASAILASGFSFDNLLWWQLLLAIVGAFLTAIILLSIENKAINARVLELDFQYETTFEYISLSLESLLPFTLKGEMDKDYCIEKILLYISASVECILKENGIDYLENSICSNLMVYKDNTLHLTHFDLDRKGRNYIHLDVNCSNPDFGAPEAFCTNSYKYIDDVKRGKYKKKFISRPYNSIVSFPLEMTDYVNKTSEVFGVVNIDSKSKKQFGSPKFIEHRIKPALDPFLSMFNVLFYNGIITSEASKTHERKKVENESNSANS